MSGPEVGRAPEGVGNTYATLAEMKRRGSISGTTADQSMWLALEGASRAVDRFCNRHFFMLRAARTFDITNPLGISIPDLVAISSLHEDTDGDRVFETERIPGEYLLYPLNAAPEQPWGWPFTRVAADPLGPAPAFTTGRSRVRIDGLWGFRGDLPPSAAGLDNGGPLLPDAETFTATNAGRLEAGLTIVVEEEQMFVREVYRDDALVVERGTNGTESAVHEDGLPIRVHRHPAPVREAALLMAARFWKRKDTPYGPTAGAHGFGVIELSPGLDPDAHQLLSSFRRLPLGVAA